MNLHKILNEDKIIDEKFYVDISQAIENELSTSIGNIKVIKTTLEKQDLLQDWHARWSVKRDRFRIHTGIYAVGCPNENSPVLVTANYKLTFDKLRKNLKGLHLWILVLDTKGINVWCAAGKGTFSTEELIRRVIKTKLKKLVSHNKLILPQLGAPGITAHVVRKHTGFDVIYGPVRAEDIREFLSNEYKTTKEMRKVQFRLRDRIVLTPVELLINLKYLPMILGLFIILNILSSDLSNLNEIIKFSILNCLPYLGALFVGAVVFPIVLPALPFRSFVLKGGVLGILWSGLIFKLYFVFKFDNNIVIHIGNTLIITSIIAFLALNFTGSTTYTSFSGVKRETILAIPIITLAILIGTVLLFVGYL